MTNSYLFSMPDVRMVRLLTTYDVFEAKLLVARLGCEGVLWELRGGVDNAYPLGPVHVYVDEADLSVAHDLLAPMADDESDPPSDVRRSPAALVAGIVVIGMLVILSVARLLVMAAGP